MKRLIFNGCTFWVGDGRIGIYSEPEIRASIIKDGTWSLEELVDVMPRTLARGLVNPSPAQPLK